MGIFDGVAGGQGGLVSPAPQPLQNLMADKAMQVAQYQRAMQNTVGNPYEAAFNPNESEVYMMPLSNLIALWRARYGDEWVVPLKIKDKFWVEATQRLSNNDLFEKQHAYVRLKEHV